MKKYILGGIAILAVIAISVANVSLSLWERNNELSSVALANIEALTSENDSNTKTCYKNTVADSNQNDPNSLAIKVIDCDDCPTSFWATSASDQKKCK
jgi:hypothetical protein